MRFTQLGHQVPRRNSRITVARERNSASEKLPSRLAADKVKSGARSPGRNVLDVTDILPGL